jgi:hypothetical protein
MGVLAVLALPAIGGAVEESDRLQQLEDTVQALQDEVTELRSARKADRLRLAEVREDVGQLGGGLRGVEIGGYGSMRWENSSLDELRNTFTLRRLVFTTAAEITPRMRFYSEIEYERFRKLELEREAGPEAGGLKVVQEVEGTDGSEIALEQAWLEYDLTEQLRARLGGLLVPLGRFNRDHDDNRWNLTRRSLVDRGVSVLPVSAAWAEMGAGLLGSFAVGEGQLSWELYVMNGAVLEVEVEEKLQTRSPSRDKLELEGEFVPQTGTFSNDTKESKALAGRFAWQPGPDQELALSFYRGRYTPDYLSEQTLWSLAVDGLTRIGGLEIEGEYVFTRFEEPRSVAQSFAELAIQKSSFNTSAFDPTLESEIEFEIKNLADALHGYWIELRYPFWPRFLSGTLLARGFENPTLIPVVRWEQVFFLDRLVSLDFSGSTLTSYTTENRILNRLTVGLAYRPTPLVAFTFAYEYLFADGETLAGLARFLPSTIDEDSTHILSFGATFGF